MSKQSMQNKHIEHPEDSILTGNLSVLDWFSEPDSIISTKIDGAPAIVWGTDPATGTFFVGTKAVFNKVKIRIAHSHEEIDAFYEGKVARILHACFDCLPRTNSIIQGDFIGYGGSDSYRPNTITYIFPEIIAEDIIIAPHTIYGAGNDLRNVSFSPLTTKLISTDKCLFVQPEVALNSYREDLADICKFAKQMATLCRFSWLNDKTAAKVKKHINDCIRNENDIDEDEIAEKFDIDINVMRLWKLVATIKEDLFCFIDERDDIGCMIGPMHTLHEGYVIHNQYGSFKVIDRQEFSKANFLMEKTW
jgi:hypothetical protein